MNEQNAAIKLRGLPFEPEQVVSILKEHPQVNKATITLTKDNKGRNILMAFLILKEKNTTSAIELRAYAKTKLYPQLVPDYFVIHSEDQQPYQGQVNINLLEQGFQPPRDATDLLLLDICGDLLERATGIDDDFFTEGGHSLLAVDLLSRIEKATGQNLPLSTMLTKSTVRGLSDALVHGAATEEEGGIVELEKGRGGRALFFLHGDYTGGGFFSREIARSADLDGPFLIVQPFGVGRTQGLELPESIEAMAAAHIESIRRQQPQGPYRLAGHCNGSVIAFEIAQQLQKAGESVEFLCMMDPMTAHKASDERLMQIQASAETDADHTKTLGTDSEPLDEEAYRKRLLNHYLRIGAEYEASVYDGPVSMILLSEKRINQEGQSGWTEVTKNCDVQRIETKAIDHLTAMQQNAATVGKMLAAAIAGIQQPS